MLYPFPWSRWVYNRPDNLVPALKKKALFLLLSTLYCLANMALFWALVGKSSTISKHYCHKLWKFALLLTTTLILSVKNGYWINWYLRSKYHVHFFFFFFSLKSTPIMTAGHGDIAVQGLVTAQKEYVRFCRSSCTTWWTKRATLLVLQPLQLFQI